MERDPSVSLERLALDCCADSVLLVETGRIAFANKTFLQQFSCQACIFEKSLAEVELITNQVNLSNEFSSHANNHVNQTEFIRLVCDASISQITVETFVRPIASEKRFAVSCTPITKTSVCCIFKEAGDFSRREWYVNHEGLSLSNQLLNLSYCSLETFDEHSPLLIQMFEQEQATGELIYHFVSKRALHYQPTPNSPASPSPVGKKLSQTAAHLPQGERDWSVQ